MTEIKTETCASPDVRTYHTRIEVSESIVDVIKQIPGVESATAAYRYQVNVFKGRVWGWDEVEPAILEFLRQMSKDMFDAPPCASQEILDTATTEAHSTGE